MKCDSCGAGYTGYIVKSKNLWYCRCRTNGCCNNKNSGEVNNQFTEYLTNYYIAPHLIQPFLYTFKDEFSKLEKAKADDEKILKANLKEVQKKIDGIEEEFYIIKSMPSETYQKFIQRFNIEKEQIAKDLEQIGSKSSNHDDLLTKALNFSLKLPSHGLLQL